MRHLNIFRLGEVGQDVAVLPAGVSSVVSPAVVVVSGASHVQDAVDVAASAQNLGPGPVVSLVVEMAH